MSMDSTYPTTGGYSQPDYSSSGLADEADETPEVEEAAASTPAPAKATKPRPKTRTKRAAADAYPRSVVASILETAELVRDWSDDAVALAETALSLPKSARDEAGLIAALLGRSSSDFGAFVEATQGLLESDKDSMDRLAGIVENEKLHAPLWSMLEARGIVDSRRPSGGFQVAFAIVKAVDDDGNADAVRDLAADVDVIAEAVA